MRSTAADRNVPGMVEQETDHQQMNGKKKRPASHILVAVLLFLALLVATNQALCFLLEPYKSSSQEMWENFETIQRQGDTINTVITGTSEGLSGINPAYLDASTPFISYNMSTNMQSLPSSVQIVKEAVRTYPVKNVILVIDHEILEIDKAEDKRAEQSLWYARTKTLSFPENASAVFRFLTDKDMISTSASLTFITPWVYNRSGNISLNVREKITGRVLDTSGHRLANGYEPDESVVDQSIHFVTLEEAAAFDKENRDTVNFQELSLTKENRQALEELALYCQENGITLYAVVAPYPNFLNIYRLEDYQKMYQQLKDLFSSYGFCYYDFNLVRPEYLSMESDDFKDVGHLNSKGAKKFSTFLGCFLQEASTPAGRLNCEKAFYDLSEKRQEGLNDYEP